MDTLAISSLALDSGLSSEAFVNVSTVQCSFSVVTTYSIHNVKSVRDYMRAMRNALDAFGTDLPQITTGSDSTGSGLSWTTLTRRLDGVTVEIVIYVRP
jgi:hypothetical protein